MTRRIWPILGLSGLSLAATLLIVSGCGGESPPPLQSAGSTEPEVLPQPKSKASSKAVEYDDLKARRQRRREAGSS
jgi:hypothetical protein